MDSIISSYPNMYFKSKQERFRNMIVCDCECDCDCPVKTKDNICVGCQVNDHAYPVYLRFIKIGKEPIMKKLNAIRKILSGISLISPPAENETALRKIEEILDERL